MVNFKSQILNPVMQSIRDCSDRNAFYIDGTYYTYRQFAERVSAIRVVVRRAEKKEQIWGLSLHDDLNTYASIFALWMEGKAYVPLHPSWPEERITSIMDADRILVLDNGRIDGLGTHEELLKNNEIYHEIFVSQQEGVLAQ